MNNKDLMMIWRLRKKQLHWKLQLKMHLSHPFPGVGLNLGVSCFCCDLNLGVRCR